MITTKLLKGVASITGAGSGIGQATAVGFVRHGVRRIAICDINRRSMEDTISMINKVDKHVEIEVIEMDVTKESDVTSGFKQIIDRFGRLDHAVNNAGIVGPLAGSEHTSLDAWQKCFAVNSTVSKSHLLRRNITSDCSIRSLGGVSLSTRGDKAHAKTRVRRTRTRSGMAENS
jgi:NAD(P)-dependent dehydrogenase (short-subunit alcohol dehydrogenase family)